MRRSLTAIVPSPPLLAVPAIWDEFAKSRMRLAAFEAGMTPAVDEHLTIVLVCQDVTLPTASPRCYARAGTRGSGHRVPRGASWCAFPARHQIPCRGLWVSCSLLRHTHIADHRCYQGGYHRHFCSGSQGGRQGGGIADASMWHPSVRARDAITPLTLVPAAHGAKEVDRNFEEWLRQFMGSYFDESGHRLSNWVSDS